MKNKRIKRIKCLSTHGGAGYILGSHAYITVNEKKHIYKFDVKCACGQLIKNASIVRARDHYYSFWENPIKWLKNEVKYREPLAPDWMSVTYKHI